MLTVLASPQKHTRQLNIKNPLSLCHLVCYTRHGLKKHTSFAHLLQAIEVDESSIIELAIEEGWITRPPKNITIVELLAAIYECIEKALPAITISLQLLIKTVMQTARPNRPWPNASTKNLRRYSNGYFKKHLSKNWLHHHWMAPA